MKEIFNTFKENIYSFNYPEENIKVIQTDNFIIQIIILTAQDMANGNVSFVNIGECEKILKSIYNISESDSLLMIKSDFKSTDKYSTNVQFELYHPVTKIKLNMSYCDNVEIKINTPSNLENNTIDLYESLLDSGYNLFDSSDSFYNDVCSTYTSENGTDMILSDRQNIIYSQSGNISLCQLGCNFVSYNKTLKTVECDCNIRSTSIEVNEEEFDKNELKNSFTSTILNSNFIILKCIKMAFTLDHILTNKGRIVMSVIIFFFLVVLLVFFVNDRNTLNKYFKLVLKDKIEEHIEKENEDEKEQEKEKEIANEKELKNKNDNNEQKDNDNHISIFKNRKSVKIDNTNRKIKIKGNEDGKIHNFIGNNSSEKKILKFPEGKKQPPKRSQNKNNTNKSKLKNSFNFFSSMIKISKDELNKINIISENKMKERLKVLEKSEEKTSINIIKKENKKIKETDENYMFQNMNDEELNSLEYEQALIYDKRTFFQYYWSLLKKDNLILFTFLPTNDYNLISLKMTLFILSISLDATINAFFFTDDTMHAIHENNGEFDIIYQIPQILYSSVISTIINSLLQKLALSEDSFLALKQSKTYEKAVKDYESSKKCLIIKFIIFICLSFILMLFCWYYISIFCAVYINTQSILLNDILLSLLLSMIYPFGLCLLPGICRIPALQDENKNKKCLYKCSGFFELI